MERFARSWHLTKLSLDVVRADKEMLLFPLLGSVFSLLYVLAILFPTVISGALAGKSPGEFSALEYLLLFVTYLGLAFIATFFNVCTVYTTKIRFDGGDATFKQSLQFAVSRLPIIFAWSLIAATVGVILRAIDHLAERAGGAGETLIRIVGDLIGMAWSIVTLFVVPAMVYKGLKPIDAIKASTEAIKRTWGESLIRHYGLGLMQFLLFFAGMLVFGAIISATGGGSLTTALVVVAVAYFVSVGLLFAVLNAVFNTALWVYAQTGSTPGGFEGEVVRDAFRAKHR